MHDFDSKWLPVHNSFTYYLYYARKYTSYSLILVEPTMKIPVLMFLAISLLIDAKLVSGCQCNSLTLYDGNSRQQIGQCLTIFNNRFWCYVNPNSGCTDAQPSSRARGLFLSFNACLGSQAQFEPAGYFVDTGK